MRRTRFFQASYSPMGVNHVRGMGGIPQNFDWDANTDCRPPFQKHRSEFIKTGHVKRKILSVFLGWVSVSPGPFSRGAFPVNFTHSPKTFPLFHQAHNTYVGDAENARHETTGKETTGKETTAPKYPKMQGVETVRNGNNVHNTTIRLTPQ